MSVRNKRAVLESLAKRFVERRQDHFPQAEVVQFLDDEFKTLGWSFDPVEVVRDLLERRLLARDSTNTIRFQRSAYLELMAGIVARADEDFRNMVFASPLQLASIVQTYAAMTRSDEDVLRVVEAEIDRLGGEELSGTIFGSVRKQAPPDRLFTDGAELSAPQEDRSSSRQELSKRESYYDRSDDSDVPAFMTDNVSELSDARLSMLVVDLASCVLRDSDEIRDQELKARLLAKVLRAWVHFTDRYERELAEDNEIDETVAALLPDDKRSDHDIRELRTFLLLFVPCLLTTSGIRHCLAGPALTSRLIEFSPNDVVSGREAMLIRTLALWASGDRAWTRSLESLDDAAVASYFSASFFSALARFAYLTDASLDEGDRQLVRAYLLRVVDARYRFDGLAHRNSAVNSYLDKLREDRLRQMGLQVHPRTSLREARRSGS